MSLSLAVIILLIALFMCVVNWFYRRVEVRNYSEWKKGSIFNSPNAWALYTLCIAIIIGAIFLYSLSTVAAGASNIYKQQNTITQQQDYSSEQ